MEFIYLAIPLASLASWVTIVVGMYLVGVALFLIYEGAMAYGF